MLLQNYKIFEEFIYHHIFIFYIFIDIIYKQIKLRGFLHEFTLQKTDKLFNPYKKYILPKAVHWACKQKPIRKQRHKIIPLAKGKVLEIAFGSGLNLPFYDPKKVQTLMGLEPSKELWQLHQHKTVDLGFDFIFINAFAEDIPLPDHSMDCVVMTYALCTILGTEKALSEIKRVLKPTGNLLFCEHGMAPDKKVKFWQNKINPVWKIFAGGCNLDKDIPKLITENGFQITKLHKMYIPGWKPASFNYWGIASIA